MPAETARRSGFLTRVLMAKQTAKGTVVSDFTTSGIVLWAEEPRIPTTPEKSEPEWMTEALIAETEGRIATHYAPEGTLRVAATPQSVEFFLRSNVGGFSGGAFTLASQVNEWFSLAWVEDYRAGATQNLVRIRDVFIHTLRIVMPYQGKLMLEAEYVAGGGLKADPGVLVTALDAGGFTLPAVPMTPNLEHFAGVVGTWTRDPASDNVGLRFSELTVELRNGFASGWTSMSGHTVYKAGKMHPTVTFVSGVSDETWALITKSRADTKERFRVSIADQGSTPQTLQLDLYELDFKVERLGTDPGRRYVPFQATGMAHRDSSSNHLAVTLS